MVALSYVLGWFHSQLFLTFPVPTKQYNDQTIIVTGSNVGLGFEAARHFVRLNARKVILAVRSKSKGEAAAKSIEQSTGRPGVIEVWDLDLSSYASVTAFAEKASSLERLDVVVSNAGIVTYDFVLAEDNESTITVNVVSGLLLSILLLPKLRETSTRFRKETVLTFTSSFVHYMTEFPDRKNEHILKSLAIKEKADMKDRYNVSKMVQLLLARQLADEISASDKPGTVTVNAVNPGFVKTEIMRNAGAVFHFFFPTYRAILAYTTEKGSRTIMHGAAGGEETHGEYLSDCAVAETSPFVRSPEGHEVQKKLWGELVEIMERVSPRILQNI